MKWPSLKVSLLLVVVVAGMWFASSATSKAQVTGANNSITVQTIEGDSVAHKIIDSAHSTWPWYVARGTGLVAAISLILLMLSGVGQITGHTYKFWEPLTAWASHRALGLVFGASILIHMISLLFDHYMKFDILQMLIPWWSNFKPVKIFGFNTGSLYLALGILAFYLSIAVVVTSLVWISKKAKTWKLIHFLSYILMAFVFAHALFIGTDLADGWLRWLWVALGVGVGVGTIARLWRAFTT